MRISSRMGYASFNNNLTRLQERTYFDNLRQATGVDIQSIAEAPTRLMDVKKIYAQQTMKTNFIKHNDYAVAEMRQVEDAAKAISDGMLQIKDLAVTSTNVTYDGNVNSIATFIKGIMTDMIRNANMDFNGKYLFSGTKTTPNSILADYPDMTNMPFELVVGESTPENRSGMSVVYKGNMEQRTINKDSHSNEEINMTGEQLFGAGGIEFFDPIIKIYNTVMYTRDGVVRETLDSMDRDEKMIVANLQDDIAFNLEKLDKETALLSARRDRIETVNLQMTEEVTRLKEVQSLKEDVQMPELLARIKQEETSLEYSLQAGSRIQQYSLFDYI